MCGGKSAWGVGRARGKISGGQTKRQMNVVDFNVFFLCVCVSFFFFFLPFYFWVRELCWPASRMTSGKLLEITGRDGPGGQ